MRAKFLADNQPVEARLEEQGFVMTEDAHPSDQVNRCMKTHPDPERGR